MRTNILGAVKISGKTRKGTSLGILNAVTQKMYSKIDFNGERSSYAVEPLSNYFVGRLEQDLDSGNTIVGGMLTATHRKIDEPQFSKIADAAYTGGLNFTKYWNDKAYFVTARSFLAISAAHAKPSRHCSSRPPATFSAPMPTMFNSIPPLPFSVDGAHR